ncbi:Sulfotransferase family protein [Paracoccus isoporae]|uniref:Sulfotransferase family protein n=1 Tax=Paracoccus isoporae TaxID=591205 RepID=A0A1G7AFN4_9RHOB|nr:sulfotransferase family 2 domain-containing protein [Paracoccus isoporae]SDE13582.1 Sulfotransferase family protein [Paracoccus isoporae]
MLIFWEHRLVFLATPKAGSTAIETALEPLASLAVQRPPEMKHADAARFHRHIHPWLREMTADHFTTVALMREPVEWLRSWYRFHLRDAQEEDAAMPAEQFEGFARRYLDQPKSLTQGIGTQSAFLTAAEAPVDRIFRYEQIDAFTRFLDEWLDCEISLPRINVPPSADVSLSPATETALRQALSEDFALYDSLR